MKKRTVTIKNGVVMNAPNEFFPDEELEDAYKKMVEEEGRYFIYDLFLLLGNNLGHDGKDFVELMKITILDSINEGLIEKFGENYPLEHLQKPILVGIEKYLSKVTDNKKTWHKYT